MQKQNHWLPILGLVLDSNWLYLAPFLNLSNTIQGAFISELSANGQPYSLLFRCLDIAAGVVWLVAALQWVSIKYSPLSLLFGLVLFTLGSADIIDSLLPLDCSETMSVVCRNTSGSSLVNNVHLYESSVAVIAFSIIAITLLISLHFNRLRRRLYYVTILMLAMMLVWLLDTLYRQHAHLEGYGFVQRLFELSFIVWFVVIWRTAWRQPKYIPKLYQRHWFKLRLRRT
ncbi:MAG: DUF998 domain-containing protein [Patescibacteria group bacterium]|nr:DUF998 domain-containing protein [Patescibacteria group bacterium]